MASITAKDLEKESEYLSEIVKKNLLYQQLWTNIKTHPIHLPIPTDVWAATPTPSQLDLAKSNSNNSNSIIVNRTPENITAQQKNIHDHVDEKKTFTFHMLSGTPHTKLFDKDTPTHPRFESTSNSNSNSNTPRSSSTKPIDDEEKTGSTSTTTNPENKEETEDESISSESQIIIPPEWILPCITEQDWTIRQWVLIFQQLDELCNQTKNANNNDDPIINVNDNNNNTPTNANRLIMACVTDDGTVVYYSINRNLIPPKRQ